MTPIPSNGTGLMAALKAATAAAHADLDGAPFFRALASSELPLESYVGQLRALATIHAVHEESLAACLDTRVGSVWSDDMRKLPLLRRDLAHFEARTVFDIREAGAAAAALDRAIRLRSAERPLTLLGALYVFEGSTLGGQALRPLFARAFGLTGPGLFYVASYGAEVRAHWTRFQERMNALDLSADERAGVIEAADECFALSAAIFRALFPVSPESKTLLATSINPEAGHHPVPEDPREVEAAIRAGDRCWEQFPYCEQRYGERGRRFSRSDAAWKASLCRLESAQIVEQTRWLGRVLAARGMPSVILQVTLEILVEELSHAIPRKRAEYEKLLRASADLLASRRAHLTDEQMRTLSADFMDAAKAPSVPGVAQVGLLLGCAVADEREGRDGAIESLRGWMSDPVRFSPPWIAAVDSALAHARTFAESGTRAKTSLGAS